MATLGKKTVSLDQHVLWIDAETAGIDYGIYVSGAEAAIRARNAGSGLIAVIFNGEQMGTLTSDISSIHTSIYRNHTSGSYTNSGDMLKVWDNSGGTPPRSTGNLLNLVRSTQDVFTVDYKGNITINKAAAFSESLLLKLINLAASADGNFSFARRPPCHPRSGNSRRGCRRVP